MQCSIRPSTPEDAAAMAAIDAQVSLHPLSESQLQQYASGSSADATSDHGLLACSGVGPVGFIVFKRIMDLADIVEIAVASRLHGRGVGRLLLQAAVQSMRDMGVASCQLEVRTSNAPALALYVSEGFTQDGVRPGYYTTESGGREDALLMSKQL